MCARLVSRVQIKRKIMDYELTKELERADFPNVEYGYHPSFEELIEACGDHFTLRTRDDIPQQLRGGMVWQAHKEIVEPWKSWSCSRKNPVEAVARLWLAIHGKEDASA